MFVFHVERGRDVQAESTRNDKLGPDVKCSSGDDIEWRLRELPIRIGDSQGPLARFLAVDI